jgi:hypothetical protein
MAEKDVVHLVSYGGTAIRWITAVFILISLVSLAVLHVREVHLSVECKQPFGPFRQYLFYPAQGMPLPVYCDNTILQSTYIAQ